DYKRIQREEYVKVGFTDFDDEGNPVEPTNTAAFVKFKNMVDIAIVEADNRNEEEIWRDMQLQQNWVLLINPEHAHLKFRLPWPGKMKNDINEYQYLAGTALWQPWAPQTSTETRLKPLRNKNNEYELSTWNIVEYEQWCFYHNTIGRENIFYLNIFTSNKDPLDSSNPPELLNNYDSTSEAFILKLYVEKSGDITNLYKKVLSLSRLITSSLNHYRTDERAMTLAERRVAPIKSSSKSAQDA